MGLSIIQSNTSITSITSMMNIDFSDDDFKGSENIPSSFASPERTTNKRKRVRIVSPIMWHSRKQSSVERKRHFIETAVSPTEIKQILRFNGCDFNGEYTDYVDKLVEIEWTPEQHQVDFYNNQSAKFIQSEDRGIDLECADLDYLANFEENELKQWAKENIRNEQPINESKEALMSLINRNYTLVSPCPGARSKVRPKRPKTSKPTKRQLRFGCDDDEKDDVNDVRMQIDFHF